MTRLFVIISAVVIMLLIAFPVFMAADLLAGGLSENHMATVIDRQYTPASFSTGVGNSVAPNGQVGMVITTSSEQEQWRVIVMLNGETVAVDSKPEQWATAQKGHTVNVHYLKGWLTGANYGWRISPN